MNGDERLYFLIRPSNPEQDWQDQARRLIEEHGFVIVDEQEVSPHQETE